MQIVLREMLATSIAAMMELVRSHLYDRCVMLSYTLRDMDSKRFL